MSILDDTYKLFTKEQKQFLIKLRNNTEFYNSITPELREHINDYSNHSIYHYGSAGQRALNQVREAWIAYKKNK